MSKKEEKKEELVAIDMANGMTYIGRIPADSLLSATALMQKVVVTPTIGHHTLGTGCAYDLIEHYKKMYEDVVKEGIKLRSISLHYEPARNIIAIWHLD